MKKDNESSANKSNAIFNCVKLNPDAEAVLSKCKSIELIHDINKLYSMSIPQKKNDFFSVDYSLPDGKVITEATVAKVKNGLSVNFLEEYMRRRDPNTMLIGDNEPTDKVRYSDVYKHKFEVLRQETFKWLSEQDLIAVPFISGNDKYGIPSLAIMPKNTVFFGFGLGLLQGTVNTDTYEKTHGKIFEPRCFMYVAPPFRQTHFKGKQVVVHNRSKNNYEFFSYNLYPGPSAKKGVYGALIYFGEEEGWVTNHAAVTRVVTPYGNKLNIMHEGASGGGKSEMNQHIKREHDGSIIIGRNTVTNEKRYLVMAKGCEIRPVTDDMASSHPMLKDNSGKIGVIDAENGWFIRVDHITNYGTDPDLEARTIHPKSPLLFLNIDAQPGSTALLWEHTLDAPGKPCPNPRVFVPREHVKDIHSGPVYIDIRSYGVRTPPCTKQHPTYGIIGLCQILPPAIAWLWRLVSPRGFENPSIITTEGMSSEGVGSYWPFATGKKVKQANLLLAQIMENPNVHYILCPVKHVGAWSVGFMPEWIMREYFSRCGGVKFNKEDLAASKCVMLGYSLNKLNIEGQNINEEMLKVELQPEVGMEGFTKGSKILLDYFKKEASVFLTEDLHPVGKKIINLLMKDAPLKDFEKVLLGKSIYIDD